MTYTWDPILQPFIHDHPELWPPTGAAIRLPPDFQIICQVSPSHLLIALAPSRIVALERPAVDNAAMGEAGEEG